MKFALLLAVLAAHVFGQESGEAEVPAVPTSGQEVNAPCYVDCSVASFLEVKAGYFLPLSGLFRKIYGTGGGIYGLEYSIQADNRGKAFAWTSVGYFTKSGRSLGESDKTTLNYVPICLGFKFKQSFCSWDIYCAAGAIAGFLHIHDYSRFVVQSISKWGVGGIAKAGALWNITDYLFFDFFADYSYFKLDFNDTDNGKVQRNEANLSGFSLGGAFGILF